MTNEARPGDESKMNAGPGPVVVTSMLVEVGVELEVELELDVEGTPVMEMPVSGLEVDV